MAKQPIEERFWKYVRKTPMCWVWVGVRHGKGYGQITMGRTTVKAHRVSYEIHHGSIPDGLQVMHACDNPPCVNPDHLSVGSNRDNMRQRAERGRTAREFQIPQTKLSDAEVCAIRTKYSLGGTTHRRLAIEFGVSHPTITNIINHKRRRS